MSVFAVFIKRKIFNFLIFSFFFSDNSKLIAQKGAFADFIVEHLREMDEDEEGKKEIQFLFCDKSVLIQMFN